MVAWSIQLSQVHNSDMSDGLYLLEQAVFCLKYCLHMRLQSPRSAGWSWSGVREKHYYLAGGWRLELERCERKIL